MVMKLSGGVLDCLVSVLVCMLVISSRFCR